MSTYTVGRTIRNDGHHPNGVPCILHDGDSVFCEFPGIPDRMADAEKVCLVLNFDCAYDTALAEYPGRNTHQMQARKVCEGVRTLAMNYVLGFA